MDLSSKVAIVTGGNRGIGFGIAKGLASAGCNVAIWGRDLAQNERAAASCAGQPGEVAAFQCEVGTEDSVDKALSGTIARFGRVDGLFANAGIGGGGRVPFVDQTEDEWIHMFDVNLLGTKRTLTAVLRHMVERAADGRGGRIVLTSSVAANLGTAFNQHYAVSKAGLVALGRAIAVEFGRHGITANALLPGYVRTEMIGELLDNQKFLERVKPRLPLKRFAAADEFAGIAIYLMSDLSTYHTGDAIVIDGGFSIS